MYLFVLCEVLVFADVVASSLYAGFVPVPRTSATMRKRQGSQPPVGEGGRSIPQARVSLGLEKTILVARSHCPLRSISTCLQ